MSASSVVVGNAAGGRALPFVSLGARAVETARRASTVTFR